MRRCERRWAHVQEAAMLRDASAAVHVCAIPVTRPVPVNGFPILPFFWGGRRLPRESGPLARRWRLSVTTSGPQRACRWARPTLAAVANLPATDDPCPLDSSIAIEDHVVRGPSHPQDLAASLGCTGGQEHASPGYAFHEVVSLHWSSCAHLCCVLCQAVVVACRYVSSFSCCLGSSPGRLVLPRIVSRWGARNLAQECLPSRNSTCRRKSSD